MKKYYIQPTKREKYLTCNKKEETLPGLATPCVGTYKICYRRKEVGRIKLTGSRGRRRQQLLDDVKEKRGCCKLKEEALDRTMWRTCIGRGYRPVIPMFISIDMHQMRLFHFRFREKEKKWLNHKS